MSGKIFLNCDREAGNMKYRFVMLLMAGLFILTGCGGLEPGFDPQSGTSFSTKKSAFTTNTKIVPSEDQGWTSTTSKLVPYFEAELSYPSFSDTGNQVALGQKISIGLRFRATGNIKYKRSVLNSDEVAAECSVIFSSKEVPSSTVKYTNDEYTWGSQSDSLLFIMPAQIDSFSINSGILSENPYVEKSVLPYDDSSLTIRSKQVWTNTFTTEFTCKQPGNVSLDLNAVISYHEVCKTSLGDWRDEGRKTAELSSYSFANYKCIDPNNPPPPVKSVESKFVSPSGE